MAFGNSMHTRNLRDALSVRFFFPSFAPDALFTVKGFNCKAAKDSAKFAEKIAEPAESG